MAGFQTIKVLPYAAKVYVFHDLSEYEKYYDDYPQGSDAVTWKSETSNSVTIVFKKWTHGNVAHEALHAIWGVLQMAGLPVDYKTQEAIAYPLGNLVDAIYKGKERWDKSHRDPAHSGEINVK